MTASLLHYRSFFLILQTYAIILFYAVQKDGFFVECGVLDGETRSNSLVFEKTLGWNGLIIEGDPSNFNLVRTKHRKVWSANACLSTKPYPTTVSTSFQPDESFFYHIEGLMCRNLHYH